MQYLELSHLFDGRLSAPVTAAIAVVVAVYFIFEAHWLVSGSKRKSATKLKLRVLQQSKSDHLGGWTCDNMFCQEQSELFDVLLPLLDYCVMKHAATELPVLSEQERLHAKMHHESNKERKAANSIPFRWRWLVTIGRYLLRDCPSPQVQLGLCGHIEATTSVWVYTMYVMPFTRGFFTNGLLYHALEETEHGSLTTQWMRNKLYTLMPLLTFPFAVVLYFSLFLLPPVMKLLIEPTLLLRKPIKTCQDLVLYYSTFVPVFVVAVLTCIFCWVLPFIPEMDASRDAKLQVWEAEAKRRGMTYTIAKTATYTIQGSAICMAQ